jgi:eukaryotic-like serine/threonine-protein kinase
MIGELLDGKYELLRLIDDSGAGAVYEARDADIGRCAVKVMRDDAVAANADNVARFEREAAAAKAVSSPHNTSFLAAGHDPMTGHLYAVMEMLEGESVLALAERLGPLQPELAIRIGLQACDALAAAHAKELVHGDVRPAHIFVGKGEGDQRVVKLLDLGFARFAGQPATPWMAPEQAKPDGVADRRSDIWSLGIVLHHLLGGQRPHPGIDEREALLRTVRTEPPPLVSDTAPWVPSRLAGVIAGALRVEPDERYQSIAELATALRSCLTGDEAIQGSMLVGLSEDQRRPAATKTRPMRIIDAPAPIEGATPAPAPAPAPEPMPAPAGAPMKTAAMPAIVPPTTKTVEMDPLPVKPAKPAAPIALDATIVLQDGDPPLVPAPTPTPAPAKPQENLGATMALPAFEPIMPSAAPLTAKPAPAPPAVSAEDAARLERHRAAQRAALAAARLSTPEETKARLSTAAFVAIGFGLLAVLGVGIFFAFRKSEAAAPVPSASEVTPVSEPAPEPEPAPPPTPEPSVATPTPSTTASSSDAAGKYRVKVTPEYAAVTVDGMPVRLQEGNLDLTGKVGETRVVIVKVPGRPPVLTKVQLTDHGPDPASIQGPPARVPGRR